ncbi:MAG: hypothetical protein ACOY4K_08860 [Pseudomonadota bacterium]
MRTWLAALTACAAVAVPAAAEEAPPGGAWTDCQVSSVAAYRDRIIVRCAAPPLAKGLDGGQPREFAIESMGPLSDPTLRLALAAREAARPLAILYVMDPVANPSGCPADRCRRIAAVELR